jgi:hypothetical protein
MNAASALQLNFLNNHSTVSAARTKILRVYEITESIY